MILVTGAAGKSGKGIIKALAARNAAVRALVRRPEQKELVIKLGAQDAMVGDMREPAVIKQAVKGVRSIYYICPNMSPDEVDIGREISAAAQREHVAHFVYHSVLHPQVEAMPHHWQKMRVEELLFTTGLNITILQPAAYMQNILAGWDTIRRQGLYRVPYPVSTRIGMVDLLDVAEAAAMVLTEPGHVGATYELAGPENLSQDEVAAILERQLGRPVTAEQISLPSWRQQAKNAGLGKYQIETLAKMFSYYQQHGFYGSSWVLSRLLSRPATDFASFVGREINQTPL